MNSWAHKIHQGLVRENQEDSIGFWPDVETGTPYLFVVADGLGGLPDGEIASHSAVEQACRYATEKGLKSFRDLRKAVLAADRVICEKNKDKAPCDKMATTLTACCFVEEEIWIAHVGDCRVYRTRCGKIKQLTKDHAVDRHTLTQALGLEPKIKVDTRKLKIKSGDIYFICSDGFYGMVPDERMLEMIREIEDLETGSELLVKEALDCGGHDNISFFLIRI